MQIKHPHEMYKEPRSRRVRILVVGFFVLMINAGYLATFREVSTFYFLNVMLHIILGLMLIVPFVRYAYQYLQQDVRFGKGFGKMMGNLGFAAMTLGFLFGLIVLFRGKMSREAWLLYSHIGFSVFGCLAIISSIRRAGYQISVDNVYITAGRWGLVFFIIAGMIPIIGFSVRTVFPTVNYSINNNNVAKNLMYDLAPEQVYNHFYASPASSSSKDISDTDFIYDSATCGQSGCHVGIYNQWKKSTHAVGALENTWYKSSVTTLQVDDEQSTVNYCSGCHAPALLLSNESEHEVATAGDDLVAKSNIGCNACHAVKRINNTIGNGDYVLQRPRSYEHMSSDVEWYRRLFAFKLHVDPDPHKEFFLKPFMTRQNSEFCSSCHKLNSAIRQTQHLSIGGMNNYDSWQKSAFAGERIDAFKHVREHDCADCHMPRMRMDDPAAKRGTVHDHSFKYNILSQAGDDADDPIVQKYKINPIQLDVVAFQNLSKDGAPAPVNYFDEVKVNITPGSAVRMEVLVQSTEVGHDFPGRYSESMETWLEISVRDQQDRMVFQSGAIDDFNRIDEKAHRWGTVYRDRKGNIVTWPHGFSASDISYNHRIQPLTSEMVPYEFKIPENCGSELYISAQIKQRRRQTNEAELLTLKGTIATAVNGMHSGQYVDTHKIIAETEVKVSLPEQRRLNRQDDIPNSGDRYDIWFNYGIALYLKGEWDEAERAFLQAAKLRSTDVHLWLNLARTALDKNDFESMEIYLEKSQSIDPDLNKITYYRALMAEKQGDLDSAVTLLRDIRKDFYADRVFLLKLAEIQMKRNYYKRAGKWYKKILEFAPDDLDAHRGLREVYKNTGNDEGYQNEDKLVRALEKALLHE